MGVNEVAHALTSSQLKKNRSGNKTKTAIFILTVRSRKFSAQTANTAIFFILLVCAVVSFFFAWGALPSIIHVGWIAAKLFLSIGSGCLFLSFGYANFTANVTFGRFFKISETKWQHSLNHVSLERGYGGGFESALPSLRVFEDCRGGIF